MTKPLSGAEMMAKRSIELSHEQMIPVIKRALASQVVPFIQSSPGMGKSAMVASIAKEYKLKMIDHRLSTSQPEDLSGLPDISGNVSTFKPFDIFPTTDTPIPDGYQGWLLFLDEFNSASKEVQAAAYKLILDRMTGQHKLHNSVFIVAAGNLSSDKAIVNKLSSAMVSRVQHLYLRLDNDWFLENVVAKNNWDPRVMAFLTYEPSAIMNFDPDNADEPFDCPRTWDMRQRILKYVPEVDHKNLAELSGLGRMDVNSRFISFCRMYKTLPHIDEILKDPLGVPVPSEKDKQFATVGYLIEKTTDENAEAIYRYITRFDLTFQIVYFRRVIIKTPTLKYNKALRMAFVDLSSYLNGLPEPKELPAK